MSQDVGTASSLARTSTWHRRSIALAGLALAAQIVADAQTTSASGGLYSEEQAVLGQTLYYAQCLDCHGEDMTGLDQAPPLTGPQFSATWAGSPLLALVERIETMPPTRPGSLAREESVALLAYMLWYNGLPIGEAPLAAEQNALAEQTFLPATAR